MMTEIKYDPELPFVVEWQPGSVWARFHQASDALEYVEREGGTFVDTTPKPKIPEDAEFIFVEDGDQSVFARREGIIDGEMHWLIPGAFIVETELIEDFIGDAEVTVLVRKDAT